MSQDRPGTAIAATESLTRYRHYEGTALAFDLIKNCHLTGMPTDKEIDAVKLLIREAREAENILSLSGNAATFLWKAYADTLEAFLAGTV